MYIWKYKFREKVNPKPDVEKNEQASTTHNASVQACVRAQTLAARVH